MATELPPIPEGFELDTSSDVAPQSNAPKLPPIPEGFELAQPSAPPQQEPVSWGDWLGQNYVAGARGMREMLPFAKDISAAARAAGNPLAGEKGSLDFAKEKGIVEEQQERASKEHPGAYNVGMGAGLLASLPAYELAAPLEAATAARLAPTVGKTAAEIAGAGATGAGIGAVQGLGEGTTLEERLGASKTGAMFGAGAGAAVPALVKGGRRALGLYSTEAEKAAERLGTSLPAAVAAENPLTRAVVSGVQAIPGAKEILKGGVEKNVEKLGETLAELPATKLGATTGLTTQEAGAAAKKSLTNWITADSKVGVDALYADVARHVDPKVTTPLTNTLSAVQSINAERLAAKLGDSTAVKLVMDAATDPSGLTYAGVQRLKREIGQRLRGVITQTDLSEEELKRLYAGLQADVRGAAKNAGGKEGLAAFDAANAHAKEIIQQRQKLAKIVGKSGDAPDEAIYAKLARIAQEGPSGDLQLLKQARASMSPGAWNDVTSTMIGQIGRDVEGTFSPDRFVTAYNKLSDTGRDILFGPAGNPLRQSLDDINTVAARFKETGKSRNFSNTAPTLLAAAGLLDVAIEGPFKGLEHDAAIGAGSIPLAFLLSRPRAARAIANWMKTPGPGTLRAMRNAAAAELGRTAVEEKVTGSVTTMPNNREERAAGGKVDKRDYPAKRLNKMERAARRAREALALESKPLMNMPDEQVADALRIAERK